MKPDKFRMLAAAKAHQIPTGQAGLWDVKKFSLARDITLPRDGKLVTVPAGDYTQLWRKTEATLHLDGELVMTDTPEELHTHLDFMLRARGHVLITGLGLGCVLRGCLVNPHVKSCTVIERDGNVLNLVRPWLPASLGRFQIIQADATAYVTRLSPGIFDCAWHDVWADPDRGEPHLQVIHSGLLAECAPKVAFQGAWAFPRSQKRLWRRIIKLI